MLNTTASTRRPVSKRRLIRREHSVSVTSDDDALNNPVRHGAREDTGIETGTSLMDHLRELKSGLQELHTRIRSLERENRSLRSELQQVQQNNSAGRSSSARDKAARRQIQLLERTIVDLKTARERDKRTIEKLRENEVKHDADELANDEEDGTVPTQQMEDLGENAIKLLRRMCDSIDMNTLGEGEECAICMEEMEVEKCYSLSCRHPVCAECFKQLGAGPNTVFSHQTGTVQCPHCRKICPREECEIITHTAVQQWDLLLDISRQWAAMDVGEIDVGEDEDEDEDEDSFIDDSSVAATGSFSLRSPETLADLGPEISTVSTSPNETGSVAYGSLPSPLKRKKLNELAAQRAAKQRV